MSAGCDRSRGSRVENKPQFCVECQNVSSDLEMHQKQTFGRIYEEHTMSM